MFRPFCAFLFAGVLTCGGYLAAAAKEYNSDANARTNLLIENGAQMVLIETMAGRYCLAQSGLISDQDQVAMMAALATYSDLDTDAGLFGDAGVDDRFENDRRPMPRPGANFAWAYLEHVYSAASVGAGAADADLVLVSDLTAAVTRQRSEIARDLYMEHGGPALGLSLESDVLNQLYSAQILDSQALIREVCLASTGVDRDYGPRRLGKMAARFDRVMDAIVDGDRSQGVAAPPSDLIRDELEQAATAWSRVRELAKRARAGDELSPDDVVRFARAMDTVRDHVGIARTLLLGGTAGTI